MHTIESKDLTTAVNSIAASLGQLTAAQERLAASFEKVTEIIGTLSELVIEEFSDVDEHEFSDPRSDNDIDVLKKSVKIVPLTRMNTNEENSDG